MKHLILAAEKGNAAAQFNLGVMYDNQLDDNGHAVRGGRAESLKWLQLAARQGMARAQGRLAEVYAKWPSTPANDVNACAWFLLAIESLPGALRQRAQSGYEQVFARLEPAQRTKAQHLAQIWKPKCVAVGS
jgi:TPR repeat protein